MYSPIAPWAPLHLRNLRGGGAGASTMLVSGAFTMRIEGIGRKNPAPYVGLSRDENIDDKESELRILVDLVNSVDVARNTGKLIIVGDIDKPYCTRTSRGWKCYRLLHMPATKKYM